MSEHDISYNIRAANADQLQLCAGVGRSECQRAPQGGIALRQLKVKRWRHIRVGEYHAADIGGVYLMKYLQGV